MVVGMLTSPDTQTSSPSVEEDGGSSLTALRPAHHAVHHTHHHPDRHAVHHTAAAFHRSDVPGSSMMARMDHSDRSEFSEQQRATSAERSGTESREDGDERRRGPSEDQTTRSSKRKLVLTSLTSGSHDASKAQDYEDKDPESPPPAKRWVIGPIFQSFKSKMASFAEIVMSPVRLFKPSEFPAESNPEAHEDREEVETDGKKDVFLEKKKKLTPLRKLEVVQRLRFDTDLSNASDSEQNKVVGSQNRSERRGDSISEDAASFGSLNSPSETSENVSSDKSGQKLIVLCEQMTTDELKKHTLEKKKYHAQGQTLKKSRLPTPAVGKTTGLKRRELVVMVKRAGTEGTIGTGGAAESPKLTMLENPRWSRRENEEGFRFSASLLVARAILEMFKALVIPQKESKKVRPEVEEKRRKV
ncbi:uncharacterized protein LOC124396511 [Silurus meridionalis]|nr:uncharacterized protein LOC124396511 [Silurus meridionalis]